MKDIILTNKQSPGDAVVMTAAIASLHNAHPLEFRVGVRTNADEIFLHHPFIHAGPMVKPEWIDLQYPAVHESHARPVHFMGAFCEDLARKLSVDVPLSVVSPVLGSSQFDAGPSPLDRPYWLLCAGVKTDYTCKRWGRENYQAVVQQLAGKVQFVQIGHRDHFHPPIAGAIDARGKTTHQGLMRLAWFARGGVGPSTFLQHICAAYGRPYVCLLGGREPVTWTHYPNQITLSTHGMLPCCDLKSCWRSRVEKHGDGAAHDENLCEFPVRTGLAEAIPRCLDMVRPDLVADLIAKYFR